MKYLVVGGGGREHAIAASLVRDETAGLTAVMATRNPGIAPLADALLLAPETDVPRVVRFAVESGVDLAVIGPEAPLEAGLADALAGAGIPAFGPTRAAARIETDKAWARALLTRHGIPGCPEYGLFTDPDEAVRFIRDHPGELAVKPVGLTGGKGVRITGEQVDRAGACAYVREIGGPVVVEERLEGEEFTLQAFVDGAHLAPMPLVQDHKRAFEGDRGPNTGGMGSYSMPDHGLPFVTGSDREGALDIMAAVVRAMADEGAPFCGDPVRPVHEHGGGTDGDRVQRAVRRPRGDERPDPALERPRRGRVAVRGREPRSVRRLVRAGGHRLQVPRPRRLPRRAGAVRPDRARRPRAGPSVLRKRRGA